MTRTGTGRPSAPRFGSSTRTQIGAVLTHTALLQTVTFIVRPTISYRALEVGVSPQWLGVIAASFTVVPLGLAVVAGRLTDRHGERLVLWVGAGLTAVAALVLLLAGTSVSVLVVSSMLLGSGQLLSMIGEQSVVAANVGPGGFDRAFSRFTFATSIGQAAGPVLILVLAGSATLPDTHALLLAATIAAALLVAVTVLLHGSDRSSRQASQGSASLGTALRVPGLGLAILVSLAVIASVDLLVVYLPVLGTERGLPASTIGALLTLRALASMGSRFFLPKLVERCGRGRLLTASIAAAALSVSCLAFHLPVAVLFVVILMVGLALGFGQPLTMAWVAEASPAEVRATALSLRLTGNRLGQTLVPAGVGLFAAGSGTTGVFLATSGALAATAFVARAGSVPEPGERQPSEGRATVLE